MIFFYGVGDSLRYMIGKRISKEFIIEFLKLPLRLLLLHRWWII